MQFHIVDCFAEERYQGNQLAVFIADKSMSADKMQRIAREMNFSETTFITSGKQEDGGFDVRIFTPYVEVPFAGHPAIGTAYVIDKHLAESIQSPIRLNLACGQIPVLKSGHEYTMVQNQPSFSGPIDKEDAARAISLQPSRIAAGLPVQCVSTGLEAVVVPLKTVADLEACAVNHSALAQFHAKWRKCNLLVYAHDEDGLRVRVFMDEPGFMEDPATGSANGDLAAYLIRHDVFRSPTAEYIVHQGAEIGRPSTLFVLASLRDGTYDIRVGGKVKPVARGEWL